MKPRKITALFSAFICTLTLLAAVSGTALANSAQTYWEGTSSTGVITTDGDCPIVVESETLTFNIREFPEDYSSVSDYLAYSGSVTAEYTFYNPSDSTITVRLVFPFGTRPDYAFFDTDDSSRLDVDTEKYDITINGETIDKRIRHTITQSGVDFDTDTDLSRLRDGYAEDSFYSPELTVTKYTYSVEDFDGEYISGIAAIVIPSDNPGAKFMLTNQRATASVSGGVRAAASVYSEQVVLYVFGSAESIPEITLYENSTCTIEAGGTVTLQSVETTTFLDFAMADHDESSGVSETDWYNAVVDRLYISEVPYADSENCGLIDYYEYSADIYSYLMRWYEYDMTIAPGERVVNTVTAPLYPDINENYDPAKYTYTYLLSPAALWADFGTLDIEMSTPFYILECSIDGFEKTDSGYAVSLSSLPDGELEFTLCEEEGTSQTRSTYGTLIGQIIVAALMVLTLIAVLVLSVVKIIQKLSGDNK
ncbi:MAG: hypothetical protein LUG17_03760 [Clostridiales bacterium]|nr:hypothetical protein [Clostridiales bacterium]